MNNSLNNPLKISIIIPSFNQGAYIGKTLDSLVSQDYPNLEIILIDGGSSDETLDVVENYRDKIAHFVSEPDKGQSDAINKGLKVATGEICNWLCSDDYLEPGALNAINQAFSDEKVGVVSGKVRVYDNDKIDKILPGTLIQDNLFETIATSVNVQPVTFFRLDFFKKAGLLTPQLHYFMDKELWIKYLLENGQEGYRYVDQVIAHYLLHPQSKTFQEMDPDLYRPSSKFKIDNNSIFYCISKIVDRIDQTEAIQSLTDSILNDYQFTPISAIPSTSAVEIINFYLYHEAKKNFYKQNYKQVRKIVKTLKGSDLPIPYKKDLAYFNRKSFLKSIFGS